jgi:DNA-binding NtrC family response regulator
MHQDTNLQGGDVLVVDDDSSILDLVTEFFAEEGYRFRRARNGLEAWQALNHTPPAFLLTDIRMPLMGGPELVRRIRASGYAFPILLMAATPALAVPLLQLDGVEFIAKPFDLDRLLDSIQKHVAPAFAEAVLAR